MPFVEALSKGTKSPILIDLRFVLLVSNPFLLILSADHRFDPNWVYGQPEGGQRDKLRGARRIANPGNFLKPFLNYS